MDTTRAAQQLHDLLAQAGFTQIRAETLGTETPRPQPPVACVLGNNPTNGPS
jgi:hypothetical protein